MNAVPEPSHRRWLIPHTNLADPLRLLLILSIALNVGLVRRVRLVEHAISAIKAQTQVKPGETVRPLGVLLPNGALGNIRYDDSSLPTLLYVMAPSCVFCAHNLPNLKALIEQATGKYRVFILSIIRDGNEEYQKTHGLPLQISTVSPQSQRDLQIGGTPTTLLISPTNKLLGVWQGAFNSEQKDEIERLLTVKLPGLSRTDGSGARVKTN